MLKKLTSKQLNRFMTEQGFIREMQQKQVQRLLDIIKKNETRSIILLEDDITRLAYLMRTLSKIQQEDETDEEYDQNYDIWFIHKEIEYFESLLL